MTNPETLTKPEDAGKGSAGEVRRWLLELKQSDKREKDWRRNASDVMKRYRSKNAKKSSFNILWSNTETLRPAIYNKLPTPDVRRRFRDEDPLGKVASEVMERSVTYSLDAGEADAAFKAVALDVLLPGRGVARVRYVPSLKQVGGSEAAEPAEQESAEGYDEELDWQQVTVEHVQWDDFRMGPGKCWREVPWVGFRHRMTQDELIKLAGDDLGKRIPLDELDDDEVKTAEREATASIFRTAEVWEIWDKETRSVIFIAPGYAAAPVSKQDDPLRLMAFFPCPEPVYAIEDSSSTEPVTLYSQYEQQADELDRISARINKIVDALKVRGIYDATLTELSQVMRGSDNDLIPAKNVSALIERGGLDKAIWMLPIDTAAQVLKVLFEQREQTKQVIYEITGVSDILRGSTNASETATAQQIKNQWGTMRLQRMQREIQRFIRDIVRLQCEIVGEHFIPETLAAMTGLKIPTGAEKAQMQAQMQMAQQLPPEAQEAMQQPSWDDVLAVLRNDMQRQFRIDIETDSTIADTVQSDMQGLQEVLTGITQLITGLGPAVQMGALPVEALKSLVLTVCRRARLGLEVEDAFQMVKQPPPPPQQDSGQQAAMAKVQADKEVAQARAQADQQLQEARMQADMAIEKAKLDQKAETERVKAEYDAQIQAMKAEHERENAILLARIDAATKIEVAEIGAQATLSAQQQAAAEEAADE